MKIPSGVPYAVLSLGLKQTTATKVDRMLYYTKTLQRTSSSLLCFVLFFIVLVCWSPQKIMEMENTWKLFNSVCLQVSVVAIISSEELDESLESSPDPNSPEAESSTKIRFG